MEYGYYPKTIAGILVLYTDRQVLNEFPSIPLLTIHPKARHYRARLTTLLTVQVLTQQSVLQSFHLLALPKEVITTIFTHLDVLVRTFLALTCKRLAIIALEHESLIVRAPETTIYPLASYHKAQNPFYLRIRERSLVRLPQRDRQVSMFARRIYSAEEDGSPFDGMSLGTSEGLMPDDLISIGRGLQLGELRLFTKSDKRESGSMYVTKGMVYAICYEMIAALLVYTPTAIKGFQWPPSEKWVRWFDEEMGRIREVLRNGQRSERSARALATMVSHLSETYTGWRINSLRTDLERTEEEEAAIAYA